MKSLATVATILLIFISASAQSMTDHHNHNAPPRSTTTPTKRPGAVTVNDIQINIPDLLVVDQNGKQRKFYSDLIKDKVVVLSFFFTSCVNVCPAMSMALAKLQSNLGDKLGKDVYIITVTKDPATDTPQKLREWGKTTGVKPGWTMVTGKPAAIEKIVRDFTGDALGRGSHNTVFFLGSDRTGEWTDLQEFVSAQELQAEVDRLASPR